MNSVPVTDGFNDDINHYMGELHLTDKAKKHIMKMIEMDALPSFAISFIGEPDENGVYHNAELIGISMIIKEKVSDYTKWIKH